MIEIEAIPSSYRAYPGIIEMEKSKVINRKYRDLNMDIELALNAVSFEFNITIKEICNHTRARIQTEARAMVVWLLIKRYHGVYSEDIVYRCCGKRFNKDRAAMRHNYKTMCNLIDIQVGWDKRSDFCMERFNVETTLS